MKLSLLSNFEDVPHEHYLLNLTFCEGLSYFHLRKCDYSEERMRRYLDRIPASFHDRIILHSHFHLVEEYGLLGAHFKKDTTYESFLGDDQGEGSKRPFKRMGFSLHTTNEVMKVSNQYDYVFLSPIFDSISNKGYNSGFKLSNLRNFLKTIDRPEVMALGGITDEKVEVAFDLGFDGIVLLGHLWTDFEIRADLLEAMEKFKHIQRRIRRLPLPVIDQKQTTSAFTKS